MKELSLLFPKMSRWDTSILFETVILINREKNSIFDSFNAGN